MRMRMKMKMTQTWQMVSYVGDGSQAYCYTPGQALAEAPAPKLLNISSKTYQLNGVWHAAVRLFFSTDLMSDVS